MSCSQKKNIKLNIVGYINTWKQVTFDNYKDGERNLYITCIENNLKKNKNDYGNLDSIDIRGFYDRLCNVKRGSNFSQLLFNSNNIYENNSLVTKFDHCFITGNSGKNVEEFENLKKIPIVNLYKPTEQENKFNTFRISGLDDRCPDEIKKIELADKVKTDIDNLYKERSGKSLVFACSQGMNRSYLYAMAYEMKIHFEEMKKNNLQKFEVLKNEKDLRKQYIDMFSQKLRSDLLYPYGQLNGLGGVMYPEDNSLSLGVGESIFNGCLM